MFNGTVLILNHNLCNENVKPAAFNNNLTVLWFVIETKKRMNLSPVTMSSCKILSCSDTCQRQVSFLKYLQ